MFEENMSTSVSEQKYKKALEAIAGASDQANPVHLKVVAQTALDWEATTADEFNVPVISMFTKDKGILDGNPLDNTGTDEDFHKEAAEIAEYDRKLSEEAESTWRDTVLHPEYKSPFDEEE